MFIILLLSEQVSQRTRYFECTRAPCKALSMSARECSSLNRYSLGGMGVNTARLRIVEVPETRFLKETGFLIFAYPSSIGMGVVFFRKYLH
jgi:hypothetical protein